MQEKQVIIIGGPTASGKSQLAIDLAQLYDGVVINADSQQLYQGIPILSACPSLEDKCLISHRLYEIWSPERNGSVVEWLEEVTKNIRAAWEEKKLPIVVGGTGLYLNNLQNGTTPIPEISASIRQKVMDLLAEKAVNEVHQMLVTIDPQAAARLSPNDTTRVRRAYEVFLDTGKKLSEWHEMPMCQKLPEAKFLVIKILPPQAELDQRCYQRFDQMMAAGALMEARSIQSLELDPKLPAMRALGLTELMAHLSKKISLEEAVKMAKLRSRQYAKRQRTWFANKMIADLILLNCYDQNTKDAAIGELQKLMESRF